VNKQYKMISSLRQRLYQIQKGVNRLQNAVSFNAQAHNEGGVPVDDTWEAVMDANYGFFSWFDDFMTSAMR
jgi:hypothetical protein